MKIKKRKKELLSPAGEFNNDACHLKKEVSEGTKN
jgi:hypothetical protein